MLFWRCGTAPCEVIANSFGDSGDLEILPACEAVGDYTFEQVMSFLSFQLLSFDLKGCVGA